MDLAITKGFAGEVSLMLGNGDGTFGPHCGFTTGSQSQSVAVGDLDNDGNPDLVTANAGDNTASVLLGMGNARFPPRHDIAVGNGPRAIVIGDFNGDGKPDLAIANALANSISVLSGAGNGTYPSRIDLPVGLAPRSIAIGDFDRDGALDIVTANRGDNTLSVLFGNGNGTFQSPQALATGVNPTFVLVADLDRDGKLDIASADYMSNALSVILGHGDRSFASRKTLDTVRRPLWIATGDLNHDGKPDLAVVSEDGATLGGHLGNGDGTFQSSYRLVPRPVSSGAVGIGDLNGDGFADLAIANSVISVWSGNGSGTFATSEDFGIVGNMDTPCLAIADLDRDRRPDLITTYGSGNSVWVLRNLGTYQVGVGLTIALGTALTRVVPNPTAADPMIEFTLARRSEVSLRIVDLAGRVLRHVANRAFEAGSHSVQWDRRCDDGSQAPPGIYFCMFGSERQRSTKRFSLIR